MCRSIKQLRHNDAEPTNQEIQDAARQFVRKVSGYRVPSKRNEQVFEQTIAEIANATRKMLDEFSQSQPTAPAHHHHSTHEHEQSPVSSLQSPISNLKHPTSNLKESEHA